VKNYKTALRHYFKIFYPNLGLDEAVEEYFKIPKTESQYENDRARPKQLKTSGTLGKFIA